MKRVLAMLLVVCLGVSLTGCNALDYLKASQLYKNEEYAQALPLYESLGSFADSAKMAEICSQKADYVAAEAFLAAKDYEAALPLYEGLGMYADSPLKAVTCRYENGLRYLDRGEYQDAIAWLEPLGNYENSTDRTSLARWLWLSGQKHTYIIRAAAGDSLVMFLEPLEDGSLQLTLERNSHLLGLPYDTTFQLTFVRDQQEAVYRLSCRSESDMVIEETVEGQVQLRQIASGISMAEGSFVGTVTDAEGIQTTSEDAAQAIIAQAELAESARQITENLPKLLENTGVDITAAQLGF